MGKGFLAKLLPTSSKGRPINLDGLTAGQRATRIDARTEGFAAESLSDYIEWRGMSPVTGTSDEWRVIVVRERANKHLGQVAEHEKIIKITEVSDTLSFGEAIKRLAVWEYARLMTGNGPSFGHAAEDIGSRHFRKIALLRGNVISTSGDLVAVADAFPTMIGTYLKRDIDACDSRLSGSAGLQDFFQSSRSSVIQAEHISLDESIQLFGAMNLLKKMAFFTEVLVEYTKVKLAYVNNFYDDPGRLGTEGRLGRVFNRFGLSKKPVTEVNTPSFYDMLKTHDYFSPKLIEAFNALRSEFSDSVFKAYHVDPEDWDKDIDFSDRALQAQIRQDEAASETYNALHRHIDWPIDQQEEDALLFVSARTLIYLRNKMEENPAYEMLVNKGLASAVDDLEPLLNYMDILHLKKMYIDLSKGATTLAQTQEFKKLEEMRVDFSERMESLKENLKNCGHLTSAREQDLERFISSRTPFYMIDMVNSLPARMVEASDWLGTETLPTPHQLSLDLPLMCPDYQG